jgi:hypothetical protein
MKTSAAAISTHEQGPALTQGATPAPDYVISRYADGACGLSVQ